MLTIRTTLKPDIGASPADLVYGEGLAVPGEALPSNPATNAQLLRQRVAALADMRLEVARLQPVQTSAHRRPLVHLPEDLETCSHVFVRRGGVQSTLASPYVGPFKVISRNNVNFKIAMPGRQTETVAISRVKPAHSSLDDAEAARPASPAPPGRPRGRRPPPQPQRPPIRRRVPRGRARPIPSDDEEPHSASQANPQSPVDQTDHPLDWDCPVDDVPAWEPPDWFDPDANPDWGADPEAAPPPVPPPPPTPPLPPTPPPPPQSPVTRRPGNPGGLRKGGLPRKRRGNPNWVKGYRRKPDVSTLTQECEPDVDEWPPIAPKVKLFPSISTPSIPTRRKPDVNALNSFLKTHLGISTTPTTLPTFHECSSDCNNINSPT